MSRHVVSSAPTTEWLRTLRISEHRDHPFRAIVITQIGAS